MLNVNEVFGTGFWSGGGYLGFNSRSDKLWSGMAIPSVSVGHVVEICLLHKS